MGHLEEGSFLTRFSTEAGYFALSALCNQKVLHFRIKYNPKKMHYVFDKLEFDSFEGCCDMLKQHYKLKNSVNNEHHPLTKIDDPNIGYIERL